MNYLEYIDYRINQFGDYVPDSKAMKKYSHKRYIDANKDWIPKSRLAKEETENETSNSHSSSL